MTIYVTRPMVMQYLSLLPRSTDYSTTTSSLWPSKRSVHVMADVAKKKQKSKGGKEKREPDAPRSNQPQKYSAYPTFPTQSLTLITMLVSGVPKFHQRQVFFLRCYAQALRHPEYVLLQPSRTFVHGTVCPPPTFFFGGGRGGGI